MSLEKEEIRDIEQVKELIKSYPDFPSEGVLFRDIFPIFQNPSALDCLLNNLVEQALEFAKKQGSIKIDAVVGLDARGFLFGPTLALKLQAKFVPVRKVGKLPGQTIKFTYVKEYGQDVMEIQADAILKDEKVLIVDDLLATGGTCSAAENLVSQLGATVVLNQFVIELSDLKGRDLLTAPIYSILSFGAWIHHLKKVTESLRFRIVRDDTESQTAISGLGRRVGQLDAGQTENAEYQGTKPDQSPHVRLAS
ncbi:hypothetical protein BB560_003071 [Smittium megazygosporum]|uniref:adenine phosphoribosyltransferase n=1 Tax=Smittium megazygosporum TaxID=133381 RepID=A0A2T9ZD24_9FUNG|nr:hypothetical protein BB560_003071 [Smittium megazygosporum]